ncbi:MAG: response regulator [Myxococcota bacterium]
MGKEKGVILLAEDDPDQVEVLSEFLRHEGYEVLVADRSLEVIRQLRENPDVVLLDLIGVSSPALVRALLVAPSRPAVVLVSADSAVAQKAKELGAAAYLAKPFELDQLIDLIEAAMRPRRARRVEETSHP